MRGHVSIKPILRSFQLNPICGANGLRNISTGDNSKFTADLQRKLGVGGFPMTVGFIMMCHDAFDRAAKWPGSGRNRVRPLSIHVDKRVGDKPYSEFTKALSDLENVSFCARFKCEWGTWSLVQAAQAGAEQILTRHSDVRHVFLASGSCLPLRPVAELNAYLDARPLYRFHRERHDNRGGLDSRWDRH